MKKKIVVITIDINGSIHIDMSRLPEEEQECLLSPLVSELGKTAAAIPVKR